MEKNTKEKPWYARNKIPLLVATGLASLMGIQTCRTLNSNKSENLNPKDFENATWIESDYSPGKGIWDAYMSENIPHTTHNWKLYQEEWEKKNSLGGGKFVFPDLDNDGKVNLRSC